MFPRSLANRTMGLIKGFATFVTALTAAGAVKRRQNRRRSQQHLKETVRSLEQEVAKLAAASQQQLSEARELIRSLKDNLDRAVSSVETVKAENEKLRGELATATRQHEEKTRKLEVEVAAAKNNITELSVNVDRAVSSVETVKTENEKLRLLDQVVVGRLELLEGMLPAVATTLENFDWEDIDCEDVDVHCGTPVIRAATASPLKRAPSRNNNCTTSAKRATKIVKDDEEDDLRERLWRVRGGTRTDEHEEVEIVTVTEESQPSVAPTYASAVLMAGRVNIVPVEKNTSGMRLAGSHFPALPAASAGQSSSGCAANDRVDAGHLKTLIEMGFDESDAMHALRAYDNDVGRAAAFLVS